MIGEYVFDDGEDVRFGCGVVGFAVGSDFLAEFPRFFLEGREFDADEFCGFFRGEGFDGVDLGSEDGDVFGFDRGIRGEDVDRGVFLCGEIDGMTYDEVGACVGGDEVDVFFSCVAHCDVSL